MNFKQLSSSGKKQSHTVCKQYQKLNSNKQQMIKRLLYVFTFYSGKVSKYAYRQLQQKYFMQLMSDIWAIAGKQFERNTIIWRNLQNIYYSKGRKNILDFNQFLDILPMLSLHFQPDIQREQSMKALLYYLNAIYDSIVIKDLKETRIIEDNQYLNSDTKEFIMKLTPDLVKLYKLYFVQQLNNKFKQKDYFYKSFQAYLQMMKQFQVYPKLISANQLFFIYHEAIATNSNLLNESSYQKQVIQQYGQYFRFSKFIEGFLGISRLSIWKLKQIHDPQVQQWLTKQKQTLKILFQYMQTVKTLKKKKTKFTQLRFSLIVYEQYTEEIAKKKTIVNDKKIQQPLSKYHFYDLMEKINL